MKYLSLNRLSDFGYHDAVLCLKNHENHHLCVTAKYLNIHKNVQENPYHYDMEIASAEMTFENIEICCLKTMEVYCFHDDGSRYLEEPKIVYTGAKAEEELIAALKKGIRLDCIAVSKDGDINVLELTALDGFVAEICFENVVIQWDEYCGKAWYESTMGI